MVFIVYAKFGNDKRFKKVGITQNSARADLIAKNEVKYDVVKSVKVICKDDYCSETLIYK